MPNPVVQPRRSRTARLARAVGAVAALLAASAVASPVAAQSPPKTLPAEPPADTVTVACRDVVPGLAGQRAARGTLCVDSLFSAALGARKQFVVWLPPSYGAEPARRYPVAYWLHGLGGNEWNWVRHGHLDAALDSLAAQGRELIAVMPDGDDGWYTTWNALVTADACRADTTRAEPAASYCVPWPHYDDYVARDLVARVDSSYRTVADRAHRGIAGLSMGGYGAVSLALRYPDVWSAAASHSGLLAPLLASPRPYVAPARWAASPDSLRARYGGVWTTLPHAFGRDTMAWWARDPGRLAARLQRERPALLPALFFDTGTGDTYVDQNRAFRDVLTSLGVAHRYAEWPGVHGWAYWRAHSRESLAWLAERVSEVSSPAQGESK